MASLKEIKARISSVSSTLKITQAMKMVASAKLRKAQRLVGGLDAYKSALYDILNRMSGHISGSQLATSGAAGGKVAVIVFSSNTALCGSYNANIYKALAARVALLQEDGTPVEVYPVGEKVAKMARKAGLPVCGDFVHAADSLSYDDMASLAQSFMDGFCEGRFARVELLYMHYYNAARQAISNREWLPVGSGSAAASADDDLIVEPSEKEVVEQLLPLVLRTDMYATMLSSNASENACRMIAMQTASDNAEDLLSQLRLTYNKQRQQDITEELTDISNGKLGA